MSAPSSIPPHLHETIRNRSALGEGTRSIAAWLAAEHGVHVSHKAVHRLLVAGRRPPVTPSKPPARNQGRRRDEAGRGKQAPRYTAEATGAALRAKLGRPVTEFTPAIAESVLGHLAIGMGVRQAAQVSGTTHSAVLDWVQRGKDQPDGNPYRVFTDRYEKAMGIYEASSLAAIDGAMKGSREPLRRCKAQAAALALDATKASASDPGLFELAGRLRALAEELQAVPEIGGAWQAAAWRLERKFPDRWAITTRLRVETEKQIGALLDGLSKRLPPAIWRTVLEALPDGPGDGGDDEAGDAGEPAAGGGDPTAH